MATEVLEARAPPEECRIELMAGGQEDFFFSDARYPGLFGGSGGGKTFPGIHKVFEFAGKHPGARILCTEPRFRLVKQVLVPTIREEFGQGEGSEWELNRQDWEITFRNGSVLILSSALLMSPQMLSGLSLAGFWMDEIAIGDQEQTFKICQARLRQKDPQGNEYPYFGAVTGTPKGMNWVYRTWGPGRKAKYPAYHVRSQDNPYLPQDYYDDLLESYGDTPFARQELGGEFVAFQGLIYFQFSTGAGGHVQEPPLRSEFERVVAGVDFSGGTSPSVIEVYGRLGTRRCAGIDEFYLPACPIEKLVDAAGELMAKHKIARFFCDPSGKEQIEEFRRAGLPVAPAPVKDVNVGIKLVSSLLNRGGDGKYGITFSSRQAEQITEFYQYQWKEQRGLEEFLDDPVKANNHCCDASRYALTALITAGSGPRPRQGKVEWSV